MSKKNDTMTYKGYVAEPYYSDEDEAFVCVIRAGRDMITFHGKAVQELRQEFHVSIDDYLPYRMQGGRRCTGENAFRSV